MFETSPIKTTNSLEGIDFMASTHLIHDAPATNA
jgi:hypothetical protein